MYKNYIKRILDFILSLIALIVLSPVLLIVAVLIKCTSKGTIFFLQERLGKNGKVFKIIKFRTMVMNAENIGDGLKVNSEGDSRITKIGKVLRKTSLDELPQLINVIKGDMAIVGPRPPVTYHPHKYEDYPENQIKRFDVRPGITGLAQVKYRNSASWDERIVVDCEYVKNITLAKDVKIIFQTVKKVLKTESIYYNAETIKDNKKNKEILEMKK